ncbi:hypothetical protein EJ05DRAFT_438934 [Pseudovirgaria hyperparasitica]|uniref:ER transporter 6TM N-terminal domain-containing protein n=1 Tax=Pseudovirgaria hyperparasitica TaxID=470096 RepID=A0A6A6W7T9_9PEZI|nr:uncharacterized protein EJ05DRAFT_438934 [Pseudovirgaria hyperparasitica]KAF2758020.1 hypothetical protein EJ05DRAFT_438934 [Pseudovirgaria hyperparasitica]
MRKLWKKTGITAPVFLNMVKYALGPTIAVAIFQDNRVSLHYGTTGYIIAVAVILSNVLAPRASFLESMLVNVLSVCLTASCTTLGVWSAFKAREHTTPPGEPLTGYNSSASAVCAVWLFFQVYIINSLKSARPQYKFAGVMATIFAVVGMIYGARFSSLDNGTSSAFGFVERFLETLLTGMAIGTATSLLVNPTNCRTPVLNGLRAYFHGIEKVVTAQREYFQSLEEKSPFVDTVEAETLRKETRALRTINTKLQVDIRSGTLRKTIEYVHDRCDTNEGDDNLPAHPVCDLLLRGWHNASSDADHNIFPDAPHLDRERVEEEYRFIMQSIRDPVQNISSIMIEAVQHILIRLELNKHHFNRRSRLGDAERAEDNSSPGHDGFAAHFEERVSLFRATRRQCLHQFCEMHEIPIPADSFETEWEWPMHDLDAATVHRQRQLFVLLHIEHLFWSSSNAFVALVRHCDGKRLQKHIIYPSWKRVRKWLFSVGRFADPTNDDDGLADVSDVLYGEAFNPRKDPERLPAKTSWQRFGASFRRVPTLLRSEHSVFGFRIACAIMSIGIAAFLEETQNFFVRQRLFWAAIICTVSMTRTAGLATWIYFLRFSGTLLAAVASYIVYYIVAGESAGTLVFLFIAMLGFGWIVVVKSKYLLVGLIAAVTTVICVGYELQVIELGLEVATSNGQDYHPLYLLVPIRLATVSAGLLVAYIFTIFPFPVTERSELRKDVGTTLLFAAHHYAIIQETINARARGDDGDMGSKASPGRRLQKERMRILAKILVLIERMRGESEMTRWQLPIDGYFPKETYDKIIATIDRIVMYSALMGHASGSFSLTHPNSATHTKWFDSFRHLLADPHLQIPSHSVTSTLYLLSSSMINAQPLPPHPPLPKEYDLLRHLQELDPHIMAVRHVAEPGYSGFAVMQIASRSIIADLHTLTNLVRGLVGELDFSYRYKSKGSKVA